MRRIWFTAVLLLVGCSGANPAVTFANQFAQPCPKNEYSQLSWSPDGQRIAYTVFENSISPRLHMISSDGAGISGLTPQAGFYDLYGWSPNNQMLAFGFERDLYIMGIDGKTRKISKEGTYVTGASWSRDSNSLVYSGILDVFNTVEVQELFVSDVKENTVISLTHEYVTDTLPEWSPDGLTIAYVRSKDYIQQVVLMNADGGHRRAITQGPANHSHPHWSPDGRHLAYIDYDPYSVVIANPDGTDARTLWQVGSGTDFQWLPDSQHISFLDPHRGFPFQLRVGDIETLASTDITPSGESWSLSYDWSSDGTRVVTVSNNMTGIPVNLDEIVILDRTSGTEHRLTDNPGKYTCFHWPF